MITPCVRKEDNRFTVSTPFGYPMMNPEAINKQFSKIRFPCLSILLQVLDNELLMTLVEGFVLNDRKGCEPMLREESF